MSINLTDKKFYYLYSSVNSQLYPVGFTTSYGTIHTKTALSEDQSQFLTFCERKVNEGFHKTP